MNNRTAKPAGPSRCAIYTRKSTEEGLEQEFNSLDAQREACAAYILSQKHEGWSALPDIYDDGGFSGGTMERPGLKQLLADVASGKVDVIVVYKVDRLTRSLADFAKIVEVLDGAGASFVSVTQSFNTTTSMGRLTLNVLLSFAQFEREVTGERIRDKVAASKKKGMWMGGVVPLGYDVVARKLVVNETEAKTVQHIFHRYLELRSIGDLAEELAREGVRSKARVTSSNEVCGNRVLSKGAIAHILKNRIYVGEIGHKGVHHAGEHQPIITAEQFEQVQQRLTANGHEHRIKGRAEHPSPLAGMISDAEGRTMTPVHATKGTRRYRYYVTAPQTIGGKTPPDGWRIPAGEIERLVQTRLAAWLSSRRSTMEQGWSAAGVEQGSRLAARLTNAGGAELRDILMSVNARVAIQADSVELRLSMARLIEGAVEDILIAIPATLVRRGVELRLNYPAGDRAAPERVDTKLLALIARAELAYAEVTSGADLPKTRRDHLTRLARLKFLAPDIVTAIIEGRQPAHLTARFLQRLAPLPVRWSEQRQLLKAL